MDMIVTAIAVGELVAIAWLWAALRRERLIGTVFYTGRPADKHPGRERCTHAWYALRDGASVTLHRQTIGQGAESARAAAANMDDVPDELRIVRGE